MEYVGLSFVCVCLHETDVCWSFLVDSGQSVSRPVGKHCSLSAAHSAGPTHLAVFSSYLKKTC